MERRMAGKSNITGFCVYDYNGGVRVRSRHYKENVGEIFKEFFFDIANEIRTFFVDVSQRPTLSRNFRRLIFLIPHIINTGREWHAVEHKLVQLLQNRQKITLENLKKAPMLSTGCGSKNFFLKSPTNEKLQEGLQVGLNCLKLKK